jgi:ferric-dicitrate binding protein FerR (iron transport regulator)
VNASGRGKFQTEGRYGAATVRGTIWLTEDFCDGTLVRVTRGVVTVEDLVTHATVTVTAGQRYFTSAPA